MLYDHEYSTCFISNILNLFLADNCPCTVDRAQFWDDCETVTGCSTDNQIEQTVRFI